MQTILIDKNNSHGEDIKWLLIEANISFIWETINEPEDIEEIFDKYKTAIYCIPLAWPDKIKALEEKSKLYNAIVIAAYDEEYPEPASWANIVAKYPITWATRTGNATGTSIACAFKTYKESKKHDRIITRQKDLPSEDSY